MNQFKRNPNFLLYYCMKSVVLFALLDFVLLQTFNLRGLSLTFAPHGWEFFLPLLGVFLCGLPSSIMHNCAHKNIKPSWLNQWIGEFCGTVMLYGFRGFALAHIFHHIHPDDPSKDPHPPREKNFLPFVLSPIKATLDVVENSYYEHFGNTVASRKNIKLQLIFFNVAIALRLAFWFLLLGPIVFVLAYLPVYAANIVIFAHINFAAHRVSEDGRSEIIDIDHNGYYKFVNCVSFGGYFHKSHHLRPRAFDPRKDFVESKERYYTYVP